jgi:tetratricopeptide (TPR) repeat protein
MDQSCHATLPVKRFSKLFAPLLTALLTAGHTAAAELPSGSAPEKLGTVQFPVSCSAAVQGKFTRAVALLHSFYWPEVRKTLAEIARDDPGCAMVHWAHAMVSMGNPYTWPLTGKALTDGMASVEKARQLAAKTERERDYIASVEQFFKDSDKVPAQTRQLAYELAMAKLVEKYPDDTEARIFHALALSANYDPNDRTYGNQLRAAQILEGVLVQKPDHPGVSHYLIHCYDSPPLAQRGLSSAYRYRDVAPSAPHALHMPSHIFTRLGMWDDSIAANTAVLNATSEHQSRLHSWDYMGYAYLQKAQDADAKRVLGEILALRKINGETASSAYALAAIPSRMVLERQRWSEAAALKLPISEFDFGWQQFPQAEAILVYARALGAARLGRTAAAKKDVARLVTLKSAMLEARQNYWADQTDIQIETVNAWITYAGGKRAEALQMLRAAADHEDGTEKSAVTPGPIIPVREQLGDMLMTMKQPRLALTAYETAIVKEPNRYRSLYGAARAAETLKDGATAQKYYRLLLAIANNPQGVHAETQRARQYLARR